MLVKLAHDLDHALVDQLVGLVDDERPLRIVAKLHDDRFREVGDGATLGGGRAGLAQDRRQERAARPAVADLDPQSAGAILRKD